MRWAIATFRARMTLEVRALPAYAPDSLHWEGILAVEWQELLTRYDGHVVPRRRNPAARHTFWAGRDLRSMLDVHRG